MSLPCEFDTAEGVVRVSAEHLGEDRFRVRVGDRSHEVRAHRAPDGRISFRLDDKPHVASVASASGGSVQVRLDGHTHLLHARAERRRTGAGAGGGSVEAPMSGTILRIDVAVGDTVERGQVLAVLTAMKMEHKLVAGIAGVVVAVGATVGETVEQGSILVRLEPGAAATPEGGE